MMPSAIMARDYGGAPRSGFRVIIQSHSTRGEAANDEMDAPVDAGGSASQVHGSCSPSPRLEGR